MMDRRRFLKGTLAISAVTVLEPAFGAVVTWLRDAPPFRWIDIPNSQLTSYFTDGGGLNPAYLAKLGIAVPTKGDPTVRWGANKHGVVSRNAQWPWTSHHQ